MDTATEIDRVSPSRRPPGRPAGYHRWSDLLFIHWRLPADDLAGLLPPHLTLDTWQGDAWVGLVPFRMSGVRPRWWPWGAMFLETNVRTYVHFQGRDPGVWFFSLEANHWLAVKAARAGWHLNYHWARMTFQQAGDVLRYDGRRRAAAAAGSCVETRVADARPRTPLPGTLEHFLIERYFLYASGSGRLWRGQVHHRPYLVQPADLLHLEESLLAANGLHATEPPCHVLYSARVDVEVFGLIPVANGVW
ncbi:MAG TPA: DUF2071 domain-containing protein [Pirellulales bacterium]|jgi:hypothetical protein|nr:DUF2071 domain-containing protein [Pirellulales bacterium]